MPTDSPILSFIRERLNDPDTNLSDVAAQAGVARNTVLALKQGHVDPEKPGPGVRHVEAIARCLGYQFDASPLGRSTRRQQKAGRPQDQQASARRTGRDAAEIPSAAAEGAALTVSA